MRYVASTLLLASVLLASCQDRYRFPCQDPKNWHKSECNKPKCKADETCTEYLIEVSNEN
jgi:hypothetical protein